MSGTRRRQPLRPAGRLALEFKGMHGNLADAEGKLGSMWQADMRARKQQATKCRLLPTPPARPGLAGAPLNARSLSAHNAPAYVTMVERNLTRARDRLARTSTPQA
jgi:hypothetical protein